MSNEVTVPVKSAWTSKINWTQLVGLGASLLVLTTSGKINIPIDQQLAIVAAIQAAQSVVTWAMKTYFTTTVTPSSAAKI